MMKVILGAVCVLVAASQLSAAISPANIAGRWQGDSWANEGASKLTLDIVRCGEGWCGVKVEANNSCGGTALRLDAGTSEEEFVQFKGSLQLAAKTEPYVVQVSIFGPDSNEPAGSAPKLQITGDTGGQFRAYRRSFPFEAQLVRVQDAVCRMPQTVSVLR
ncbi:MAG: hypothetical protein WC829_13370 [Hyphomicrobium sp.]|jgi:hypothetical protein